MRLPALANVQVRGRKRLVFYPPEASGGLYPYPASHPLNRRARVGLYDDPVLYLSYTAVALSYTQESLESVARCSGWLWGVVGVQPRALATSDASIPATWMVGTAHSRVHPKIGRSNAIFSLCVSLCC